MIDGQELQIVDEPSQHRYEARLGDTVIGFTEYRLVPGRVSLYHTEVDPAFEGRGVAGRLAAGKHAVSRSAMRAVIDSHGRLDVRRERTDLLAITDPRVRPSLANSDRGALP